MRLNKSISNGELLKERLSGVFPKIQIAGDEFIINWRQRKLRHTTDQQISIDLEGMPMTSNGESYLCFYHLPTKSIVLIDENITEMPKDTVLLEIPNELMLDPVGVAIDYGFNATFLLDRYPIIPDLKAKVLPLEETGLPDLIRRNQNKPADQSVRTFKKIRR